MYFPRISIILAVAGFVQAQLPSQAASLPSCALQCTLKTVQAGTGGCTSLTDFSCICQSVDFQRAALACYQQDCPAVDIETATSIGSALCTSNGTPINFSAVTASGAGSATISAIAPGASSSNAAIASSVSSQAAAVTSAASSAPSATPPSSNAEKFTMSFIAILATITIGGYLI